MDTNPAAQEIGLPVAGTRFVGRRRELAHVRRLLATARLVTLTGVGGCGKSRLAVRVADETRRRFADGVRLVGLATLTDGALLEYQVAQALGIHSGNSGRLSDLVVEYVRDRELLLVLDNCEHLLDACARFVYRALRAAAGLRVLCTSRQPLRITGENVFVVPPLPVPERGLPLTTARYPALTLFVEHARTVAPGFSMTRTNRATIGEICRRLDGLPLAIELAAAQLRTLPLEALQAGLAAHAGPLPAGDHPLPRHHTLQAAFDWSHELCTKSERLAWARVSVFSGSFDLGAAEAVCAGGELAPDQMLKCLAGLIDKSVLVGEDHANGRRYRLLETVRQYGLARLRATTDIVTAARATGHVGGVDLVDEAVLRGRHRGFYLALAERFDADWFGPRQPQWSRRMRAEHANLRAALGHCLTDTGNVADAEAGLRLAGALFFFWWGCGAVREGLLWLQRALTAAPPRRSRDRLRALTAYTQLLQTAGEPAAAMPWARRSVHLARQLDEPALRVWALANLGASLWHNGDAAAARAPAQQAESLAAELEPDAAVVIAKVVLALVCLTQGDAVRAAELSAEARAVCRGRGELWGHATSQLLSTIVALARGEVAEADGHARESLRLRLALGDTVGLAGTLERLAWIATAGRDHSRAARLFGAADRQWRDIGKILYGTPGLLHQHDRYQSATRQALGDAVFTREFRHGAKLNLDSAVTYALDLPRSPNQP